MIMPKDTLGFIGRDNLLTSSGVLQIVQTNMY